MVDCNHRTNDIDYCVNCTNFMEMDFLYRSIVDFCFNRCKSLKNFDTVLIPEINNGQLIKIIRDVYFVDAKGYNKIMGVPITKTELLEEIKKYL